MVQLRESESLPLFPKTAVLYIFVLSQLCGFAFGTYSIVGADRDTYLIGGAAASCVPGSDLGQIIYHGKFLCRGLLMLLCIYAMEVL